RIKRISKYNSFKADEYIANLEADLRQVHHDLEHLTDFSIAYFQRLIDKYGKGKERKTEIISIESIAVQQVVANNAKLYINRADGFVGMGMKKDEFVCDCSDIDDIIAFTKDGKFKVVKIADKVFMGKDIIHVAVFKKGDERTTYNMIYIDGKSGVTYAKRFNVTSITRDKDYDLTKGEKGSKVIYFTVQPNGESEKVSVQLSPGCSAKKKVFEFDFGEIGIKGRSSQGNIVTKYPIRKVVQLEVGKSSLGALKVWLDPVSGRINTDERGKLLGEFDTGEKIITIYNDGHYELNELDLNKKYDMNTIMYIGIYNEGDIVSAVYYEGEKGWTMVKRFMIETSTLDAKFKFITDALTSKLYYATLNPIPHIDYAYKVGKEKHNKQLVLSDFIDVKGWKALGNRLIDNKLVEIRELVSEQISSTEPIEAIANVKLESKPPIQGDL
ncbi:MAG TPA: DNA gyrase/topoisomerase IV subunit A, partial [Saprospiraceae bacterium]|nr:DNA gyrase/topoisomerase IV subunit A [Saprospiraceae bacterium]